MVKDRETWCVAVHGVEKSQTGLSDWTTTMVLNSSFVSFLLDFPFPSTLPASPLSPCLPLPFRRCPHLLYPSLPPERQSPFLHSLQALLPPSLPTFCWVATFKVLKLSKSLIVCPNLERRSIRNNKPEKQNVLQKIFQLRVLSGHNMIVDKEWRKLFTELPITIYWVLRAMSISEMNKAWSLPSSILNIVQKIQCACTWP